MHGVVSTAVERSSLQSVLICACLFTSLLSGLLTALLYVELRHGSEQLQEMKQVIGASRFEVTSCLQELKRMPTASSWSPSATLPVTPLPAQLPAPRQTAALQRGPADARPEKDTKPDIPEDGKFVLVGEDGKVGGAQEKRFKLLGEK